MAKRKAGLIELLGLVIVGVLGVSSAMGANFSPKVHNSEWMVEGSQFGCRLAQPIPDFGKAVFFHEAGEQLSFILMADAPKMKRGRALIQLINPAWKPDGKVSSLGYVDVRQDQSSIEVDEKTANRMLQALFGGRQVEFTRQSWYDASQTVRVAVSNVNFRGAYDKYVACLAELLPVNFAQIERTSLLFKAGQELLSEKESKVLDDILTYAQADTDVQSFFIDGHSDSQGTRAENLEVSKRRAEKVMKYLTHGGVEREAIVLRWHGERYPVASNRTASGRAKNRRVTVRVSKEAPPELPDLEMAGVADGIDPEAIKDALSQQPKAVVPPTIDP